MSTDLLGREMSPAENTVLTVYRTIRELVGDPALPPCALANMRAALTHCAIAVNDLALDFEHLVDVGC